MTEEKLHEKTEQKTNGYKGFDKNMCCRDQQYEVGREYEWNEIEICRKGGHFCENPLDVFGYYPPSDSRYAVVESNGEEQKETEDSKVCTSKLKICAEIRLPGLITAGVKFILDRVNWSDKKESNTEYQSAATNTGDRSAATNTGDRSAADVSGSESIAFCSGIEGKVRGTIGCYLVLADWENKDGKWRLTDVKSVCVDGTEIKADVWYRLNGGKFLELEVE